MDDLLGEDWQSKPANTAPTTSASSFASNYNSFRASPQPSIPSIASPLNLSRPSSTVNNTAPTRPATKPSASTSDAFGNLTAIKSQKAASNLSIQDRQRQLIEEKRRQQEQQAQLWDTLGSGRATPEVRGISPAPAVPLRSAEEDVDDILAAFNRAAPVDKASHYPPPPSNAVSGRNTPAFAPRIEVASTKSDMGGFGEDDDDPFGLGSVTKRGNGHVTAPVVAQADDDDILGDLGKPVTERLTRQPSSEDEDLGWDENIALEKSKQAVPAEDRALAELIDMGFPADKARLALAETGGEVQGAVAWLLQQAHEESKQKVKAEAQTRRRSPTAEGRSPARKPQRSDEAVPAWMREERSQSASRRQDSRSPANGEKDPTQVAQELGSKLFKGANSLWKASQKQMAKTMAEFQQQERDPSQPKWMQETATTSRPSSGQRRPEERPRLEAKKTPNLTDEAALLDMPRDVLPTRPARPTASERPTEAPVRGRTPVEPMSQRASPQPRAMQQQLPTLQDKRPTAKLSRQEVEDQSAQAYVSPARRKRPTPKPEPQPEPEVDFFSPAPVKAAPPPKPASTSASTAARPATARATPVPSPRSKAPPRNVPSISPSALSSSAAHRKTGGEAFKRGDYVAAHEAYTAALTPLPPTHPITIIVLSNRSLTALKTGDAKVAVSDADRALEIIGPSQGVGESIELGGGEGAKDMREFFGKALVRKAEALEHMEKWNDAAAIWRQAVEAGIGGTVSLRGKQRCEQATSPKPPPAAQKPKAAAAPSRSSAPTAGGRAPPAKGLGNTTNRPVLSSAVSAQAVRKLREANAAAERADDEKFALTDQVDARLAAWKGGKADNLRALLQSLDNVLWPEAGWKKVGMSDLIMANKVKIIYMKAIAKVHPDKIPQSATTEQRMISANVFATLNEAWDKFKKDNGL